MHVTLLAVPGCPHLPVLEERLAEALGGLPAVTVSSQIVATEEEAASQRADFRPAAAVSSARHASSEWSLGRYDEGGAGGCRRVRGKDRVHLRVTPHLAVASSSA